MFYFYFIIFQTDKASNEVIIRIDHADVLLGDSSPLNISEIIEEDALLNVNHTVIFEILINKKNSREAAVSTPILSRAISNCNLTKATLNIISNYAT